MWDTDIGHTSAVGLFPNGLAACDAADMAGDVWEWCRTKWIKDYSNYEKMVDDNPIGSDSRVLRGGSWGDDAVHVRAAVRSHIPRADYWTNYIGFRCSQ